MAKRIREKSELIKQNKETRPYASVRYAKVAPTKAKIVIDQVRGKSYDDAVAILANMPHDAAAILLKVVKSAGANAENNKSMSVHDLFLAEIILGQGPTRVNKIHWRGRGHGAERITSRTSHIKVVLDVKE